MKIAISGKGGVGKTTIVAILAKIYSQENKVIVIDCDPDANLGESLGFDTTNITPVVEMKKLIEERTEARNNPFGVYKLNPNVSDIPGKYFLQKDNIKFMIMGIVKEGGSGCFCPENTFIKALLSHLVLERKEILILDMPAGIEHLTRGTSKGIDNLIVVVEPTSKSIESAKKILKLSQDLGIKKVSILGNKIKDEDDKKFILDKLSDFQIIGFLPYDEKLQDLEQQNSIQLEKTKIFEEMGKIKERLN